MDEQETQTPEKTGPGLIPSLKQTWESAKTPIAVFAVGFIVGYYMKGRTKILS